jgi:SAM-dependent methyltransferase
MQSGVDIAVVHSEGHAAGVSISPNTGCDFHDERAARFLAAMAMCPDARQRELDVLCETVERQGEPGCRCIVDLGAGHGYATWQLLRFASATGTVHAVDISTDLLRRIPPHPQIRPAKSGLAAMGWLEDGQVDLVVSLASFHHVPNKNRVMREVHRIMRPGGVFVLVDVVDSTAPQRFFDDVVREHCVTGHDVDFLSAEWVHMLAGRANVAVIEASVCDTPWKFGSEATLLSFVRDLFALRISHDALKVKIEEILGVGADARDGSVLLTWSLGYYVMRKALE